MDKPVIDILFKEEPQQLIQRSKLRFALTMGILPHAMELFREGVTEDEIDDRFLCIKIKLETGVEMGIISLDERREKMCHLGKLLGWKVSFIDIDGKKLAPHNFVKEVEDAEKKLENSDE